MLAYRISCYSTAIYRDCGWNTIGRSLPQCLHSRIRQCTINCLFLSFLMLFSIFSFFMLFNILFNNEGDSFIINFCYILKCHLISPFPFHSSCLSSPLLSILVQELFCMLFSSPIPPFVPLLFSSQHLHSLFFDFSFLCYLSIFPFFRLITTIFHLFILLAPTFTLFPFSSSTFTISLILPHIPLHFMSSLLLSPSVIISPSVLQFLLLTFSLHFLVFFHYPTLLSPFFICLISSIFTSLQFPL